MNREYQVSGKTITLKRYANVHDTIKNIKRIIKENYLAVEALSSQLQASTEVQTFENIWDYVRESVIYQNDEKGKEQLRRPQRTLHDKIGDCDDFSILISAILLNLNIQHELVVAAYKKENQWQHIYPVSYDIQGNRYVIDCVPEIPYFNYEAHPIKNKIIIQMLSPEDNLKNNNMKLEELGQLGESVAIEELTEPFNLEGLGDADTEDEELLQIQGLLGNVAIVDEDEEYDTVLSGIELYKNIILRQLIEAKKTLTKELTNPTDLSQLSHPQKDLEHIDAIIEALDNDEEIYDLIQEAINSNSLYKNFYKTILFAVDNSVNGLAGEEDDLFYLKVMDQEGLLDQMLVDDDLDGLGRWKPFSKLKSKIKKGVHKFKKKYPKLAKIGHALKKYSPSTFGVRKSIEIFLRANTLKMASKLAIGYATEFQANKIGYSKSEWLKFVEGKNKAESRWYSLGGKKSYFKKMIMSSQGAKAIGLKGVESISGFEIGNISEDDTMGELGIAPAVIAAVTKVFGALISFFKKLKLKKKQEAEASVRNQAGTKSTTKYPSRASHTKSFTMSEEIKTDEKSGVSEEVIKDEKGKDKTIYRDKEGNEIGKFKALFLKHKKMIIIISIVLVVGIIAIVIWKIRQRSLNGLGSTGLSIKQKNFIRRQGLNNRAYGSLVREEISKDGKKYNKTNRKIYYKKVFRDAFSRPISQKQTTAALNHNDRLKQVRILAKQYGGGSEGWRKAWSEVKKKR